MSPELKTADNSDSAPTEESMMKLIHSVTLPVQSAEEVKLHELHYSLCDQAINDTRFALNDKKKKHLRQQSSLIGHVLALLDSDADWLNLEKDEELVIVEFGAGKAQLSYMLAQADCLFDRRQKTSCLIVDKSGSRNKFDNKLSASLSHRVARLRCDIEHLRLSHVTSLAASRAPSVVGLCKHLCGAGTDLAIRCALNAREKHGRADQTVGDGDESTPKIHLAALALAPCCHHRCDWTQFCGREFLSRFGIDSEQKFTILRKMVSWATCAFQFGAIADLEERSICEQKETLGRKVQLMFELARMDFLKRQGFDNVELVRYVPWEVTPQNYLIIAR